MPGGLPGGAGGGGRMGSFGINSDWYITIQLYILQQLPKTKTETEKKLLLPSGYFGSDPTSFWSRQSICSSKMCVQYEKKSSTENHISQ